MLLTPALRSRAREIAGIHSISSFIMEINRSNSMKVSNLWPAASNIPDSARNEPAASQPTLNCSKALAKLSRLPCGV